MSNSADECRLRADECRRHAGQVTDDVLRGTYLDLARRWRMMAHQAKSLEQKAPGIKTTPIQMMSGSKAHQRMALHVEQYLGRLREAPSLFGLRAAFVLAPKKVVAAVAHWMDHC